MQPKASAATTVATAADAVASAAAGPSQPATVKAPQPATPKGRDTRDRIKQAATRLYGERSYAVVRVADITDAAGLTPGAFYRYFEDRRELMLELLQEVATEVYDFARSPMDEQSPITSVLESTRRYFAFYEQHRALFGLMLELSQSDADVAALWAKTQASFYARISRSLGRGIASGSVRPDLDTDTAAELLGSMTEFYAFQRFVLGSAAISSKDIESAVRTLADIWVAGVATERV